MDPIPDAAVIARTSPQEAIAVEARQLRAVLALLRDLDGEDWGRPTDCTLWDVRAIVAHLVGWSEVFARPWLMARDLVAAGRRYPGMSRGDAVNQVQVDDRADRSGPQLTAQLARLAPKRLRARRRIPGVVRQLPVIPGAPFPAGTRIGYVLDVIAPRDLLMHRIDIARATGRDAALDEDDREVVRQVVADLARSWTRAPVTLELTGPAGGRWIIGTGDPAGRAQADTVEHLRCLAGRNPDPAFEVDGDPALRDALAAARVPF